MIKNLKTEGTPGFDWNAYQTDSERIRTNSHLYASENIIDAFKKHYGLKGLKIKKINERANDVPQSLGIGQTITARISAISKGNVVFDCGNLKEEIVSSIDLSRFPRFKKNIPNHEVELYVVGKRKSAFIVDCLQPLHNQFNERIESNIKKQYVYRGEDKSVTVHNLRWVPGGFIGKLDITEVSDFTGETTQVDVFIPGSQIVLNIERDFSKWEGATVQAFITNFNRELLTRQTVTPAIICSVKRYLEHQGNVTKIDLFKAYTEDNDEWKKNLETRRKGVVTGVINTAKKCGAFVELPELNITGLVTLKSDELVNYKPGDEVDVRIVSFDEIRYYDKDYDQVRHAIPYVITDNLVKECNLKPVLQFA